MTLPDAVEEWARRDPAAPALIGLDGSVISYAELAETVAARRGSLRGLGGVTAVVDGDIPLLAAVAGESVCAPLPPGLAPDELDTALRQLGATYLILPGHEPVSTGIAAGPAVDAALLIRTSGSTGAAKLVPLTAGGLLYAAGIVATTLGLSPADRCLNPMPLHHTHGLVGAALATLGSGGSVTCLPRYSDEAMERALTTLAPTWYTAVPSIHARVAALAEAGRLGSHGLRFARSASAPLTGALRARLGRALGGVPVLSTYALTEAPGQVCGHRPGDVIRDGSVGRAVGCEVAVVDGRILVRGPHVSAAHRSPDGWLRTGDLGTLTGDGELFLHGREDDVINRAGEKISPEDVEAALAADPRVADVVVFGADDVVLGQAVVALVVPADPGVSAGDLRLSRVLDRIVLTGRIPRSTTGKVNRKALAADLPAPGPDVLAELRRIWAEVLFLPDVEVDADFAGLGGGSLQAARIEAQVAARLGVELPAFALQDAPTVRELAEMIEQSRMS
ncbi:non-ribosomal peptide synthetase [Streptosporangiaceae bacterium NEAU-GS5]|nr:non-ribosomal peptide synthetase [Streptosporangiaceae bacterium NEAU-GS5]